MENLKFSHISTERLETWYRRISWDPERSDRELSLVNAISVEIQARTYAEIEASQKDPKRHTDTWEDIPIWEDIPDMFGTAVPTDKAEESVPDWAR